MTRFIRKKIRISFSRVKIRFVEVERKLKDFAPSLPKWKFKGEKCSVSKSSFDVLKKHKSISPEILEKLKHIRTKLSHAALYIKPFLWKLCLLLTKYKI